MTFSAIIFDCDGVLVDSEVIYLSVEREHLARIGFEYDQIEYRRRFMGLKTADYMRELGQVYQEQTGRALPENFSADMRADCIRRLEAELRLIEGADALIESYAGAMAVASSSAVNSLHMKLRVTGLHRHLDPHIYSGDEVENGKPAPDLFLMAAERIGIAPSDCLVIEDSENGVRAGVAAGMPVWGFTGGGHADGELGGRLRGAGAQDVLSSFAELQARAVG